VDDINYSLKQDQCPNARNVLRGAVWSPCLFGDGLGGPEGYDFEFLLWRSRPFIDTHFKLTVLKHSTNTLERILVFHWRGYMPISGRHGAILDFLFGIQLDTPV